MRKHPLIALIAFAFLATATFIGASGARTISAVPVRATSHIKSEAVSSRWHTDDLRWVAAVSRERAALAQFSAVLASEYSPLWRGRSADIVAIHDGLRELNGMLPSAWRALRLRAVRAAAARAAATRAYERAQAAEAQAQAAAAEAAQQQPAVVASPPPPPPPKSSGGGLGGVWLQLRLCESGNNYQENTGNGYYGAYQFLLSTWLSLGYSGLPSNASPAVQDQAAVKLQALAGWGQWPACSAQLGL